jgi:hypothetical protein
MKMDVVKALLNNIQQYELETSLEFTNDKVLITEFLTEHTDKKSLSLEDVLQLFDKRWSLIQDTQHDYTRQIKGVNQYWVLMAEKVALKKERDVFEVLMPTISQQSDKHYVIDDLKFLIINETNKHFIDLRQTLLNYHDNSEFMCFEDDKSRAFTVNEISRIKAKKFSFDLTIKNHQNYFNLTRLSALNLEIRKTQFDTLWEWMTCCVIRFWNKTPMPENFWGKLENLIYRFQQAKQHNYKQIIDEFSSYLNSLPNEQRYAAFNLAIRVDGELTPFIQWWLAICNEKESKLLTEIKKIGKLDFVKHKWKQELARFKKQLTIETLFEILNLTRRIETNDDEFEKQIKTHFEHKKGPLTEIDVIFLKQLYAKQWSSIRGSNEEYTYYYRHSNRKQNRVFLARVLAKQGFIDSNFYKFLIPSIEHDNEPYLNTPLSQYPITELICDDEGQLIPVQTIIDNFKPGKFISKPSYKGLLPLSKKEFDKIKGANEKFTHLYTKKQVSFYEEKPISYDTVNAVKKLIEDSFFEIGLFFNESYNSAQVQKATNAIITFSEYLQTISEDEKLRLFGQRVRAGNRELCFGDVWSRYQLDESYDECIALLAKFGISLVIDYFPDAFFNNPSINKKNFNDIDFLRLTSKNKVVSDVLLTEREAELRCIKLMSSLLKHNFTGWGLRKITYNEYSNSVTKTGEKLFNYITKSVDNGHSFRFIYSQIQYQIVTRTKSPNSFTRSIDTQDWIDALDSENLFNNKTNELISPQQIASIFYAYNKKSESVSSKHSLKKLCENLAQLCCNYAIASFEFNVLAATEFNAYKEKKPEDGEIIAGIESSQLDFMTEFKQFMIHSIADDIANSHSQLYFFPSYSQGDFKKVRSLLKRDAQIDNADTIEKFIQRIRCILQENSYSQKVKVLPSMIELDKNESSIRLIKT